MLIPRCENLNCIRKHKINVLIFFFFLPVFKNWLLTDLSVLFLPPFKQWPIQGHLWATAAVTCKRIHNRLHLQASPWKRQSSFVQCPGERGMLCREWKRHCPSPKSSQAAVHGSNSPRWRQIEVGWCWPLSALTPEPWARWVTAVWAQLVAPRPGLLFQDPCECQWCRSGEHISQCLFCYGKEESLHCVKMFCIVQGASGHCSNITLITGSAKINHILHWLMSLWKGMASLPANLWLLIDKMYVYMEMVYS